MYYSRNQNRILIVWVCVALFLIAGCGKKGPPISPDRTRPPAVNDLNAAVRGDSMSLSWTVPEGPDWEKFIVYRAKRELFGLGCSKCPPKFEKAATVRSSGTAVLAFTEKLEIGYKYFFKVVGRTNGRAFSGDSNVVELVH